MPKNNKQKEDKKDGLDIFHNLEFILKKSSNLSCRNAKNMVTF